MKTLESKIKTATKQSSNEFFDKLWTVNDVAQYLAMRPKTIYKWVHCGRIPCRKLGSAVRFDRKEIEKWLSSLKEGGQIWQ